MGTSSLDIRKQYYQCLGVSAESNLEQVKSAYKRLALIYHPDKNKHPDATTKFQEISHAYHKLASPKEVTFTFPIICYLFHSNQPTNQLTPFC